MSTDFKIEAILFDMDGLLLDSERLCLEAFVETRKSFGLSAGAEVFLRIVGLPSAVSDAVIAESLSGRVGIEAFNHHWNKGIQRRFDAGIPLRPGVRELFSALSERDIPMGVATSTDTHRAITHLQSVDLLSHFDSVIGGDRVRRHKPDPEVYLSVAAVLGADPRRCLAFEDSDAGTRAAVASGARVIQVPDLKQPSPKVQALGHIIAPDILSGAVAAGLLPSTQMRWSA